MKKQFLLATVVALLGCGAVMGYRSHNAENQLSALQLENIEAIADDEGSLGYFIPCHSSGMRDEKSRYTDCSTCLPVIGYCSVGTEARCKR